VLTSFTSWSPHTNSTPATSNHTPNFAEYQHTTINIIDLHTTTHNPQPHSTMPPFTFTFKSGTGPSTTRKIATPSKTSTSSEARETIHSLIKSSQPRKFADPKRTPISDDLRAAIAAEENELAAVQEVEMAWASDDAIPIPHTLGAQVKHRRARHHQELLALLTTAIDQLTPLSKTEDLLAQIDPVKLAQAWEAKTWSTTYMKTGWELDAYVEAMEQEVADLEIWVQHWDSELGGEDMFCRHVLQHFSREFETGELGDKIKSPEHNAMANETSAAEPLKFTFRFAQVEQAAPSSPRAVGLEFADGPVAFGYSRA
jgi:hypothetical protein